MRTDDRRLAEGAQQRLELALPGGRLRGAGGGARGGRAGRGRGAGRGGPAPLDSPGPGEVVRLRPAGGVESPHI